MSVGVVSTSREEFVKGQWIQLPPASLAHARLIQRLNECLWEQLDRSQYAVYTTSYALGIERGLKDCRNPDLAVFRRDDLRGSHVQDNNVYAVPLLIVECLSPRDRKGALRDVVADYHRMGAPEVWIIDPQARTVSRHAASDERSDALTSMESPLRPTTLPQVVVEVDELWRAFDGEW